MSDLSRRGFLRRLIAQRDADAPGPGRPSPTVRYPRTGAELDRATGGRRTIPLLRPPGAIEEHAFLAGCTRCGDCATACPHDAIHPAPPRFREAAGTPTFDPIGSPCLMCESMPCIAACEPGVLSHAAGVRMGTARIDPQVCLAHLGTGCTACVEQCPVPGAIALEGGRLPAIDEETCTGCGVCQHVCPAPHNAVAIMPTLVRPGRGA